MKTEHFATIDAISETSEGLNVRFRGGASGFLASNHEPYANTRELFQSTQALSNRCPWPVWVVVAADGLIVKARTAMRTRVIGISEEPDGSCRVGMAFTPTVKLLRPDHPDFERLKETLLAAATTRHDVFDTEMAGSQGVLDDVALAPQM